MNGGREGTGPRDGEYEDQPAAEPVEIDGTLDLHMFLPRDTRDLVNDYLDECREQGVLELRIVHGKGQGVQREIVHSVLRDRDDVVSFRLGDESRGSWGATLVQLQAKDPG